MDPCSSLRLAFLLPFLVYFCKGDAPPSSDWESFKSFHGKFYVNDASENVHKTNFLKNVKNVEKHNKAFAEGKVSYEKELNKFADMDSATYTATYCGYVPTNQSNVPMATASSFGVETLATNFDWRDEDMVTPIKDQGRCGSCWAFSAVGAMESQVLIKGRSQQILSEQQLVDCDRARSHGCNGGQQQGAFEYVKKVGGITTAAKYPYTSGRGQSGQCKYNVGGVVKVASSSRVERSADAVMKALVAQGPLAIALDGTQLQSYKRGVLTCRQHKKNHAVVLVGYGNEGGKDYWLIKNSYGARWGDKGFAKVSRGRGQDCGITEEVSFVVIQ